MGKQALIQRMSIKMPFRKKSEKIMMPSILLQLISGKWKILIMKSIAESCPKRFGELRKGHGFDVSGNTFTTQLRELEENGLICRKIYAEVPPKVEYKLSNLGITLTSHYL